MGVEYVELKQFNDDDAGEDGEDGHNTAHVSTQEEEARRIIEVCPNNVTS